MSTTLEELPHGQTASLLDRLQRLWPDSMSIHYSIQFGVDWAERGSELKVHILVPASSDLRDEDEGLVVLVLDRPTAYKVLLYCPEHREDALLDMLFQSELISWSRAPEFCRVPQRIAVRLRGRLDEKQIEYTWDEDQFFWLPKERALQELPLLSPPDNVELRTLQQDDVETLTSNYPLLSAGTLSLTKDIVAFNKTLGLCRKDNGRLVGWAVQAQWGSIGQVMVLPDHRGQGLARVVVSRLARLIAEQGFHPYSNIETSNQASLALFRGLGFTQFGHNSYVKCLSS